MKEIRQESSRKKEKIITYLWLMKVNMFISAFTFGGGYVVVPMVRKYFIEKKHMFSEEELMEMAAIAQSTPGAIAVNMASLAGYRTAGKIGMLISCVCAVIPPVLILSVVSVCYTAVISNEVVAAVLKGMQAGVAALIVDFIVDMTRMIRKEKSRILDLLVILSFAVSFFTSINVILVLLCSCAVCILRVWMTNKKAVG
ncbi:chromate transporter%2C chromate ion transporter (CHR) family [uncultured Roseburia sp.]|uniref:Chromate transporter n=1 Tax=Brotonthovivens ammoniilytica TaxID=2981725 RepID=A0ABT2TND8_9FIRM|nr:chromate transporter [Brotonthovivens ammoniilytica]MCU6763738.1 chromate transporter [Brotonthovivens ammoniilytica]SCJ33336.1 chromate transporter%2C chromate ion transporter (CHR) family [uncultured Roseburia sp.]